MLNNIFKTNKTNKIIFKQSNNKIDLIHSFKTEISFNLITLNKDK